MCVCVFYSDVLGRLKAIQPLEQVLVRGQTLENKREFILENIRFVNKPNNFFYYVVLYNDVLLIFIKGVMKCV